MGYGESQKFELIQYHLEKYEKGKPLSSQEIYNEFGEIKWDIQYEQSSKTLNVSYTAEGCQPFSENFEIGSEYKYFKVFAWADKIDFEIHCRITMTSLLEKKEDEKSTSTFTLGKIIFRLGDMFDPQALEESHIIMLPASSNGTATDNISKRASEIGIPYPQENPAGSILLFTAKRDNKLIRVGYAYSVDGTTSNTDIISRLCKSLIDVITKEERFSDEEIRNINLPLFGTGAGNVDPVEVALIYDKEFNNPEFKFSFVFLVSIQKAETFQRVKNKFDRAPPIPKKISPDIKSRLHSDTYNLDEADVLNYDLIAENLFAILTDEATNPPLNIGIIAPWGRGKTSLMKRLKKKFDVKREDELSNPDRITKKMPKLKTLWKWLRNTKLGVKHDLPYATVWFNPWNYQSSDMIWAGLADAVISQVVKQIPGKIDKEIFWMQLRLARIDKDEFRKDLQTRAALYFLQFFVWGIIVILSILYFLIQKSDAAFGILGFGSILGVISSIASKIQPYSKTISEAFDKYTKSPKYTEKFGTFHEVQNDLERVLELCIDEKKPLIIFVDDLDRCSPSKVVEVIEAINVFINGRFNNKCYFILGMDAEMVAAALDVSYEKMKGKMGSKEFEQGSIGWYFLDKFIQLPFFIPIMSETKKQEFLISLLKEKEVLSDNTKQEISQPNKKKVEEVFSKVMSTNDNQESSKTIKNSSLTIEEEKELDKMILKNQIESNNQSAEIDKQVSIYAQFISSDPRSLKRFINLLRFYASYQFLRMKKGKSSVEIKVLAKWLALMVKFPQLVRWIQWDSENKSGVSSVAEDKANMLDKIINEFTTKYYGSNYDFAIWLETKFDSDETSKKLCELEDMPWLKSRNMFKILMNECSEDAKFINALNCNVW